jgi:hypothetical protein
MIAKLNKVGFTLCVIYLLMTLFLVWSAYSTNGDVKGQFVLLQLPIALPLMLLDVLGVSGLNWSWYVGYAIFIPLMLFVLYYVGVGFTHLWRQSKASFAIIIFLFCLIVWYWNVLRNIFNY